MNKSLLLLVLAFITGTQAAFGDIVNNPSSSTPTKMYHGSVNFDRALPERTPGPTQQTIIEGAALYAFDYGIDDVNRLAKEGILVGSTSEDYLELKQGNVLLNPSQDIIIGTSAAKISIGAGASTFIMLSGSGLIVYDLSQQITVSTNEKSIILEAGQMLVLAYETTKDFEKLNLNCHSVSYSNAEPLAWHSARAFLANFSVHSALNTIEPLIRLAASHNKRDRLILAMLTKNIVPEGNIMVNESAANDVGGKSLTIADGGL